MGKKRRKNHKSKGGKKIQIEGENSIYRMENRKISKERNERRMKSSEKCLGKGKGRSVEGNT